MELEIDMFKPVLQRQELHGFSHSWKLGRNKAKQTKQNKVMKIKGELSGR
jgi:hypothetical protein